MPLPELEPRIARTPPGGFTLIELLVVVLVSVPILGSILATNQMVREENAASDASSDAAESCRAAGQRLALYARAGLLSTCEVRATQQDVDAAIAAQVLDPTVVVPAIGDWIPPADGAERPSFRFQAAAGVLSLRADAVTPAREFEFVMEPGETANGFDDDGDGMIDEGKLQLRISNTQIELIATGVEVCKFSMSGRVLSVQLQTARRDHQGHVYRAAATQTICMRNN